MIASAPLRRLLAFLILAGCQSAGEEQELAGPGGAGGKAGDLSSCTATTQLIGLEQALGGVQFTSPIAAIPSPVSATRWYVVEKRGVIWAIDDDGSDPTVFADVRSRVNAVPNEAGLL